jgi:hypothetical protein
VVGGGGGALVGGSVGGGAVTIGEGDGAGAVAPKGPAVGGVTARPEPAEVGEGVTAGLVEAEGAFPGAEVVGAAVAPAPGCTRWCWVPLDPTAAAATPPPTAIEAMASATKRRLRRTGAPSRSGLSLGVVKQGHGA